MMQATEITRQGAIECRREFDGSGIVAELVWTNDGAHKLLGSIWRDGAGEPWKARLMNAFGSGWNGHFVVRATRGEALDYLTTNRKGIGV